MLSHLGVKVAFLENWTPLAAGTSAAPPAHFIPWATQHDLSLVLICFACGQAATSFELNLYFLTALCCIALCYQIDKARERQGAAKEKWERRVCPRRDSAAKRSVKDGFQHELFTVNTEIKQMEVKPMMVRGQ